MRYLQKVFPGRAHHKQFSSRKILYQPNEKTGWRPPSRKLFRAASKDAPDRHNFHRDFQSEANALSHRESKRMLRTNFPKLAETHAMQADTGASIHQRPTVLQATADWYVSPSDRRAAR